MVTPGPASIVVIPFPFSDLSNSKLRPAVVFADVGRVTANESLMVKRVAVLNDKTFTAVLNVVIDTLQENLPK